jgi:pimeloyl-ACP methyl ester carboxylesterase
MSLDRWDADLGTAIDELIDTAAVESVWVVGLRLGGLLAIRAAERPGVEGIVLWDPILSGAQQLAEAITLRDAQGTTTLEVGGIPIAPTMQHELNDLHVLKGARAPRARTLIAVSADERRYRDLEQWLAQGGSDVTYVCVPSDGRWSYFDNWGSALIPQELIRAIVDYLKGAVR